MYPERFNKTVWGTLRFREEMNPNGSVTPAWPCQGSIGSDAYGLDADTPNPMDDLFTKDATAATLYKHSF
jgi:hypothetical protein